MDHKILTRKLGKYGICGKICYGLKVIFQTENNILNIDAFSEQKFTNLLQLKCGVPQGSILGPRQSVLFSQEYKKICFNLQIMNWKRFPNGLRLINFH